MPEGAIPDSGRTTGGFLKAEDLKKLLDRHRIPELERRQILELVKSMKTTKASDAKARNKA